MSGRALAAGVVAALALTTSASANARPRYDVPAGFTRCPQATAWNGFFKWASVHHGTCRAAAGLMRAYARTAESGPLPRHVQGFRCRVHTWRNADGDVYASRHRCVRDGVTIRFYGMA